MKKIEDILLSEIKDIISSPRWKDFITPAPNGLIELSERINDGALYKKYKENQNFTLLIELIESYERAINDDWMPDKIEGLTLKKAHKLIIGVENIIKENKQTEYTELIKELYHRIHKKHWWQFNR